jgi:CspA family cold shock protein
MDEKNFDGVVFSFQIPRGFGFIRAANGKNYFTHIKDWMIDGDEAPTVGQRVQFELVPAEKGPKAVNVRIVDQFAPGANALANMKVENITGVDVVSAKVDR